MTTDVETLPTWPYSGCVSVEDERRHRKEHLAAAFRLFARYGFDEGVAGHITVRDPAEPDHFWVNPFGHAFRRMRVSDLQLVNSAGEVIEGGRGINRSAFAIHSQIHAARPDVVAAAHSHSVYGKAWASLARPLDMITQDHCDFFEDHRVYDSFEGVVLDTAEGRRIASALGETKAVILRNHGLLSVGHSVDEAAWWFIRLEACCHVQLLAEAAGTPTIIDAAAAAQVHAEQGSHLAGWFTFQPLFDQIAEEEPSLFD